MNFEFAEIINPHLMRGKFTPAIELAEKQLTTIPPSPFHAIIERSLLGHTYSLCRWIDDFHRSAAADQPVRALYFELTEFDINVAEWAIDGFAYAENYGLEDPDWLADYCAASESAFILAGYEPLQEAFAEIEPASDDLQNAQDWCEQLIIARYMQLMQAAHTEAKLQGLMWAALPIYCTEHGYDLIVSV